MIVPARECVRLGWKKVRLAMFAGVPLSSLAQGAAPERVPVLAVRDTVPLTRERLTLELRIGGEATLVIAFESTTGAMLLPVAPLLALAEVEYGESRGIGRGRLLPSGTRLELDPVRHRVRHGTSWRMVPPGELALVDGAVVASAAAIAFALGVQVVHDRTNAVVELRDASGLPLLRRLARERARRAAGDRLKSTGAPELRTSLRRGIVVDYGIVHSRTLTPFGGRGSSTTVGLGVGLPVATGVLMAHGRSGDARGSLDEISWQRTWPASKLLSSLQVGSVLTSGPRGRVVDGVAFSNAALGTRGVVDLAALQGVLSPGWSLDAWHDGTLVASTADVARPYDLRVPLTVGSTLVDLVASGPNGQERAFQRVFHTPPLFVPAGTLEYAFAAGACPRESGIRSWSAHERACLGAGVSDLRYGLSRSWVLRAGAETMLERRGAASTRPYGGISGVVGRIATLDLTVGNGVTIGRAVLEPTPTFLLSIDGDRSLEFVTDSARPTEAGQRRSVRAFGRVAPGLLRRRVALEGSILALDASRGSLRQQRADLALQLPAATLRGHVRHEVTASDVGPLSKRHWAGMTSTLLPGRSLGATFVRGGAEWARSGGAQWQASIAHSMGRWRLDAGVARREGVSRPTLTLSLASQGGAVQASTLARSGDALAGSHLSQALRGSLTWDASAGSLTPSIEGGMGRSGVGGTVFLDLDEDGTRDAGEPGLRAVRVRIDHRVVTTGVDGRYLSWGHPPNSLVHVAADSSTLASPLWLPAHSRWLVRTPAAALTTADIPILAGGAIEGRFDSPVPLTAWPRVRLTRNGDASVALLDPFADGSFYMEALRPGVYRVEIDSTVGAGWTALPVTATVGARRITPVIPAGLPALDAGGATVVLFLRRDPSP